MTQRTDDEMLTDVKRLLAHCAGFEGSAETQARLDALNYYFQRERGDEIAGRSRVVSGDVSAMVEANLSQMLEAFRGESLVEFRATDADDEDQAHLEADVCTELIMGDNNGYIQLAAAIKDALLLRNGVMEVGAEIKTVVEIERLQNTTPEALALLEEGELKAKIIERDDRAGTATIRVTAERKSFIAEAFPLEEFLYTKGWHSLDLQDIPCCGRYKILPRSDLIALGFDKKKVEELPKAASRNLVEAGRNPFSEFADRLGADESQDPVELYRVYFLADRDGDGISERLKMCFSGNTVLSLEEVALVPFAAGTAILAPHRFEGISLYDKLRQIQDVNTGLERGLLDNMNTATKNRTAGLDGAVNKDDIDNGRADGHIRISRSAGDVRSALMAFSVPDLSQGILMNLEHQRSRRSEMGGAALELSTGNMQLNERLGSEGVDRMYSVMEQLASMMTNIAAQTLLRSLFLLTHATLRANYDEPFDIKINGRWETANPSEWKARHSCIVKPGMSPGERTRLANTLLQMLDMQMKLAESGLDDVLVDVEGFYKNLMDWARTMGVPNPQQYLIDPQSDASKQAALGKQKTAAELRAAQQRLMDQAMQIEQLGVSVKKYQSDQETQWKYFNSVLGAEIKEAEISGRGIVDIIKAKLDGQTAARAAATAESAVE